jgi:tetratricopeptide (TPR) repeat protein
MNKTDCMKKISILMSLLVLGSVSFAQKAKVVSAYNYEKAFRERGEKCPDLAKGIEAIDAAAKDESTSGWAKTWYYRGNLYYLLMATTNKDCKSIDKNPLDKCYESYMTCLKKNFADESMHNLDLENSEADVMKFVKAIMDQNTKYDDKSYTMDILGVRFPALAGEYINKGVTEFQDNKNYAAALENFEKGMSMTSFSGKIDTNVMYYAALAADNAKNHEKANLYYSTLIKMNYQGKDDGPIVYANYSRILEAQGDTAKSIEILKAGRAKYPNDRALLNKEINYYLTAGKNQEALQSLKEAVAADPENPGLYAIQGSVLENLGETAQAETAYKRALELEPENFDANYNLGAMYFNKGVEYNNEANNYSMKEMKKIDAAQAKALEEFKKAQPYLEKANQLNPTDVTAIEPLLKIYAMTNQNDKYKALKATLQN